MDGPRPSPTRAWARAIVDRLAYGGNIIEIGTHWTRSVRSSMVRPRPRVVVQSATIIRVGVSGAGHMGALETICMTVSNATGLASLAITYANWRKARKNPPTLTFTVTGPLTDEVRKALDQLNRPEDEEKDAS